MIGYAFLKESMALSAFAPRRPAVVKPVTRIEDLGTQLAVPRHVAPTSVDPLEHVLFALKHEGTQLALLMEALPRIAPTSLLAALQETPNGAYIRTACYLWESATGERLAPLRAAPGGPVVDLFDAARYLTGPAHRDAKWRVSFNGLGSLRYSATVERTATIARALDADILGQAESFAATLGALVLDRAISWAYLNETRDSFAIEREVPSDQRARAFAQLLRAALQPRPLSEDYLVELQAATVANPFDKAAAFRSTQNWLHGPAAGAAGVTYVPPPPALMVELMAELMGFANTAQTGIDPLVVAAINAFGFVFIHPFTDGNGRLSRFLFHHALGQSGRLKHGLVLPVSVAMKRNEDDYLAVLREFSGPARELWEVRWIGEGQYAFTFRGADTVYRHWDATRCVEFGMRMARQALDVDLREETEYLRRYDEVHRAVNARFDMGGYALATLVRSALEQRGVVSINRRKQFAAQVPEAAFELIEAEARRVLAGSAPS